MSHFNIDANKWDTVEKYERARLMANKIKDEVSLDKKIDILDFGCGTGLLGLEFLNFSKMLLGIDTSSGMLEVFEEKVKGHREASSLNIDLENESLDQKFDLIISSMTFHHLKRPARMLTKLSNMLNEGGKVLIIDLETEDGTYHPDNSGMGVKHFGFSREQLVGWAKEANLNNSTKSIYSIEKNNKSYGLFLSTFS